MEDPARGVTGLEVSTREDVCAGYGGGVDDVVESELDHGPVGGRDRKEVAADVGLVCTTSENVPSRGGKADGVAPGSGPLRLLIGGAAEIGLGTGRG